MGRGEQRIWVAPRLPELTSPEYLAKHGTPRSPKELARHSCMAFTGLATHPLWNLVGPNGARATVRANGAFSTNEAEALVAATLAGRGS